MGAVTENTANPGGTTPGSRPVVAALDGDRESLAALLVAAEIARANHVSLLAVCARRRPAWSCWAPYTVPAHLVEESVREAVEQLRARAAALVELVGVPWQLVWQWGSTPRAAVRIAAQTDALAVVIPSHRDRRWWRWRRRSVRVPRCPRQMRVVIV